MKKKLVSIGLSVIMAAALAGCGSSQNSTTATSSVSSGSEAAGAAASSGTTGAVTSNGDNSIVVAMGSGFDTLDPGYVYEKNPPLIINACYDNLFKFVGDGEKPEPDLADSYEFSDDNKTLTVTLKDATFASGNPVTSEDVAFSINRCKNLKGNPSFICDTIDSIETPDDKTVVFHLNSVDSAILSKLTYSSMAILDSKVVKEHGGTDAEDAPTTDTAQSYLDTTSAGSGMYVLTSYTPDSQAILEKNENYWGTPSNIDKVTVSFESDANSQMMALSSGDVDIAVNLTDDTMAELQGDDTIELANKPTKTVGFVMMNEDPEIGGPVADPKVQQAIRKALDYSGIQTICGEGTITPYSVLQEGFMGSKGERSTDYTDIEEAKKLLSDAGYPDGFDIDLTVCDLDMEGILMSDLAQKVKEDLSQIGINVNIVSEAWAAGYGDDYRDGKLGFTVMYWGIDYNDPNVQLAFLPGQTVGLRANWTEDKDPDLAGLVQKTMDAVDDDERTNLLGQIQDDMYENGPFIFIAQAPAHMGYNKRLTGVTYSDVCVVDLTQVSIAS